jgi:hypothetical protein
MIHGPRHLLILDQLALEKQLWLLTGFQMQNLGETRFIPKPICETGRMLVLYGNLGKCNITISGYHAVNRLTNR